MKLRPRRIAGLLAAALLAVLGCVLLFRSLGGNFDARTADSESSLSPAARKLVDAAFDGLPEGPIVDQHVHLLGSGRPESGSYVNPKFRSWRHPIEQLRWRTYLRAAAVDDGDGLDAQYVTRLLDLTGGFRGRAKFRLLALDFSRDGNGAPDLDATMLEIDDDRVFQVAALAPERFEPVASIHPYRPDAVAELERCVARGARMVKWIPSGMAIDPADPRCVPFYDSMARLGVALLSHAGEESSADVGHQEFGNPLRLRLALDRGVTVIAAHCASLGRDIDLDRADGATAPSFDLFLRLLAEPRSAGRLFGDISAVTQFNRCETALPTLLARTDLQSRLVYGSDYPLPAVNCLVHTGQLADLGLITRDEMRVLDEIYSCNPLLFDFVLKRTLRDPKSGARFDAAIFTRTVRPEPARKD
jgi:predicted TIM-barrel fold metal-dependent hydrolase